MSKGKRITVSFTENELKLVMEVVGQAKPKFRARQKKYANRYGVRHDGKHFQRNEYLRMAQMKMSAAKLGKTL